MASPNRPAAAALLLVVAAALLAARLFLRSTSSLEDDRYLGRLGRPLWGGASVPALPFSPTDVLPLLPRGVAMAALRALRGVSDIFPVFVGAAPAGTPGAVPGSDSGGEKVRWKGACFYDNEAWLVLHNESGSKYGGGTLHLKVRPAPPPPSSSSSPSTGFAEFPSSRRRKMTNALVLLNPMVNC